MSKTPNSNSLLALAALHAILKLRMKQGIKLGTKDKLIYPSISMLENGRDIMPTPQ
jgi:hypothetical protein